MRNCAAYCEACRAKRFMDSGGGPKKETMMDLLEDDPLLSGE